MANAVPHFQSAGCLLRSEEVIRKGPDQPWHVERAVDPGDIDHLRIDIAAVQPERVVRGVQQHAAGAYTRIAYRLRSRYLLRNAGEVHLHDALHHLMRRGKESVGVPGTLVAGDPGPEVVVRLEQKRPQAEGPIQELLDVLCQRGHGLAQSEAPEQPV